MIFISVLIVSSSPSSIEVIFISGLILVSACGLLLVRSMPPPRVDNHDPDSMSQILMVLSSEQLARMLDFWGSKATQRTQLLLANIELELNYHRSRSFQRDGTYLCPVSVDWSLPVDAFQILTVLSSLTLAMCLPSGLKQTLRT